MTAPVPVDWLRFFVLCACACACCTTAAKVGDNADVRIAAAIKAKIAQDHPQEPKAVKGNIYQAAMAFLWAFPLANTAPNFVSSDFGATSSTMNSFMWQSTPNNASYNSIVSPNVNVLYGPGFFDLTHGPIKIAVPNTAGRYYVLQCMNM